MIWSIPPGGGGAWLVHAPPLSRVPQLAQEVVVARWAMQWIAWGGTGFELHTPVELWDFDASGLVVASAADIARLAPDGGPRWRNGGPGRNGRGLRG